MTDNYQAESKHWKVRARNLTKFLKSNGLWEQYEEWCAHELNSPYLEKLDRFDG